MRFKNKLRILMQLYKFWILTFIFILTIFCSKTSYAGDCSTTINSATTNQLECADDDNLNVTSAG